MAEPIKNNDFNLSSHLTDLLGKYCERFSDADKTLLTSAVLSETGKPDEVYDLEGLSWFPSDEDMKNQAPQHRQNQEKIDMVKKILENLAGNESKISKDLHEILASTDLVIAIRPKDQWNKPNGGAVFKRGKTGEKNTAVLFVSEVMFSRSQKEKLPGLLAHEMGHFLDFYTRPRDHNAKLKYMDGAETFADITGELLAKNAGYTSKPWAVYLLNESMHGNNPENTHSGMHRARTIFYTSEIYEKYQNSNNAAITYPNINRETLSPLERINRAKLRLAQLKGKEDTSKLNNSSNSSPETKKPDKSERPQTAEFIFNAYREKSRNS